MFSITVPTLPGIWLGTFPGIWYLVPWIKERKCYCCRSGHTILRIYTYKCGSRHWVREGDREFCFTYCCFTTAWKGPRQLQGSEAQEPRRKSKLRLKSWMLTCFSYTILELEVEAMLELKVGATFDSNFGSTLKPNFGQLLLTFS